MAAILLDHVRAALPARVLALLLCAAFKVREALAFRFLGGVELGFVSLHEEVESQSCRVDSLQALLDDLDDLVRADAARARRATRGRAGIVAAAALGGLAAYVVLPLAL